MKNMKWYRLVWIPLTLSITLVNAQNAHNSPPPNTTSSEPKKLVCFYHSWNAARRGTAKFSPLNINPYLCTHIVYANGDIDNEHGIRPTNKNIDIDQNGYILFTGLKKYNKRLKALLGIGGLQAGTARYSALVTDETRRKAFPRLAVEFVRQYNFDGINLNWNFPGLGEHSRDTDKDNYLALTKALRKEIEDEAITSGRPKLLLTMSLPPIVDFIDRGYAVGNLSELLDFMHLLTYDFHLAYEPYVSHHAPLYAPPEFPDYTLDPRLTVNYTINHLIRNGADPKKLILGLPAYGRTYTLFNADLTDLGSPADGQGEQGEYTIEKEGLAFFEICDKVTRRKGWTIEYPNREAMGPYAYRGNQWISFDDNAIIEIKIRYALENHLGGILFMSMDMDDFRGSCFNKSYPLIEAARKYLRTQELVMSRSNTTQAVYDTLTTPEPPSTPDPDEDPNLSKARITRIIQDMLESLRFQGKRNVSSVTVPNGITEESSTSRPQDIFPQLTIINPQKDTDSGTKNGQSSVDQNIPEYIRVEDITEAPPPRPPTRTTQRTTPNDRLVYAVYPPPHMYPVDSQQRVTNSPPQYEIRQPTTKQTTPPFFNTPKPSAHRYPQKGIQNGHGHAPNKPAVVLKPLSGDEYDSESQIPTESTIKKHSDRGSIERKTNGLKLKLNYSLEIESDRDDHVKILESIFH